jgi:hypothetical protein
MIDVARSRHGILKKASSGSDSEDDSLTWGAILSPCACIQFITEEGNTVIANDEFTSPRVSYFAFKNPENSAIDITKVNGG